MRGWAGFLTNAAGVLFVGVLASAAVWHFYGRWEMPVSADIGAALQRHHALENAAARDTADRQVHAAVPGACLFAPVVPSSGERDHRFRLEHALSDRTLGDPAPFLAVAKEARSERRFRDAEVALIVACRVAARTSAGPSVRVGEVERLLAEHYIQVARMNADSSAGTELLERAGNLMQSALRAYSTVLGEQASRTRKAREELASLRNPATRGDAPPDDLPDGRETRQLAGPPSGTAAGIHAAAEVARSAPPATPSRRNHPEDLVRADPELAQLDADLRRLRSQAASVSSDRAGMQRRSAAAQADRDHCRDRACLLRWYQQRRSQLLAEF